MVHFAPRLWLALALAGPACLRADGISSYADPNWHPDTNKTSRLSGKSFMGQESSLAGRNASLGGNNAMAFKAFPVGPSTLGGEAAIGERAAKIPGEAKLKQTPNPDAAKSFAPAGRSAPDIADRSFSVGTNAWSGKAAAGLKGEYPTASFEGKMPTDLSSILDAYQKPNLSVEEVKELLNTRKIPQKVSAEVRPEAGLPLGDRQREGVHAEAAGSGSGPALPASAQGKPRNRPGVGR